MEETRIDGYIRQQAGHRPEAPAFYLSSQEFLSYGKLAAQIESLAEQLRKLGFGRRHRLAIVLPHGAEAALIFYAVTQAAAAVPLNPASPAFELTKYLEIANVDAVITASPLPVWAQRGGARPANPAADALRQCADRAFRRRRR